MAAKSSVAGKELYLEFNSVDISLDVREFDPGLDGVYVDSTAGADEVESQFHIRDTLAPTASFLVQDDATGLATKAALEMGVQANLIWGPRGNSGGLEKWGITAEVKMANIAFAFDAEQVLDVEWVNVGRGWLYDGRTDTF